MHRVSSFECPSRFVLLFGTAVLQSLFLCCVPESWKFHHLCQSLSISALVWSRFCVWDGVSVGAVLPSNDAVVTAMRWTNCTAAVQLLLNFSSQVPVGGSFYWLNCAECVKKSSLGFRSGPLLVFRHSNILFALFPADYWLTCDHLWSAFGTK